MAWDTATFPHLQSHANSTLHKRQRQKLNLIPFLSSASWSSSPPALKHHIGALHHADHEEDSSTED